MNRTNRYMIVAFCAITLLFTIGAQSGTETKDSEKDLKFYDIRIQTPEFIGYYNSIKLTPEQEKLKKDVLSAIPAPCCTEYSIATCCCPCNLAKSVWGLSNYAIAKLDYDANKLKKAVNDWISFTHKNGFAGDSCSSGRCGSSFAEDGCGGMKEGEIVY